MSDKLTVNMSSLQIQVVVLLLLSVGVFSQTVTLKTYDQADSDTDCVTGLLKEDDRMGLSVTVTGVTTANWGTVITTHHNIIGADNICKFTWSTQACDLCTCTVTSLGGNDYTIEYSILALEKFSTLQTDARWYENFNDIGITSTRIALPTVYPERAASKELQIDGTVEPHTNGSTITSTGSNATFQFCVTNLQTPYTVSITLDGTTTETVSDTSCVSKGGNPTATVELSYTETTKCQRSETFTLTVVPDDKGCEDWEPWLALDIVGAALAAVSLIVSLVKHKALTGFVDKNLMPYRAGCVVILFAGVLLAILVGVLHKETSDCAAWIATAILVVIAAVIVFVLLLVSLCSGPPKPPNPDIPLPDNPNGRATTLPPSTDSESKPPKTIELAADKTVKQFLEQEKLLSDGNVVVTFSNKQVNLNQTLGSVTACEDSLVQVTYFVKEKKKIVIKSIDGVQKNGTTGTSSYRPLEN